MLIYPYFWFYAQEKVLQMSHRKKVTKDIVVRLELNYRSVKAENFLRLPSFRLRSPTKRTSIALGGRPLEKTRKAQKFFRLDRLIVKLKPDNNVLGHFFPRTHLLNFFLSTKSKIGVYKHVLIRTILG